MKRLRVSRPSPALVISVIALVAALGGTAFAAGRISGYRLKPHTVGGGKLKQFTGGMLKKQSLGGGKMKPNTVKGFEINEGTLSTVPSAVRADVAGTAAALSGDTRYNVKLGFGQSRVLATVGPFTLIGQCLRNATDLAGEPGRDIARILISTSEAGAYFQGSAEGGVLQPTTPEAARVAVEYTVPSGGNGYGAAGFVGAYAPSGAGFVSPAGASNEAIGLFGVPCVFQGAVLKN